MISAATFRVGSDTSIGGWWGWPRSSPDWLDERGREAGPLWTGQRGRLTDSGIAQVVLAVGKAAGIDGLRPHRLRHTFATRLRQGGADPAQVQSLLGHSSLDTSARYFRAGTAETAAVVERVFE
ncbi:tyrosine-type recombinase/integrase [Actinoallomurus sp. NPDC052308]|uniref:tyrosine-type recombinase/integrase n=1 Tax=Actinoallomurus sp. NPDC052308 TaxID=3155530 RepID=UPI003417D212